MGKSLLAALAAVAMVFVAIGVRDRMDNPDTGKTGSGALRLVCATELRAVCEALEGEADVTVEPVTVTAQRLQGLDDDDAGLDGWIAPGPWAEYVNAARAAGSDETLRTAGDPLARSPFVLAVRKSKRAGLKCAEVGFGCIGDSVNARSLRVAMPSDDDALGVLADGALSAGHLSNPNFATNDLTETDLADWLTTLDASADNAARNVGGGSFTQFLAVGAAGPDAYLSIEADLAPQLATAATRDQFELITPRPGATADVVFAARPGGRGDDLRRLVVSDRVRTVLKAIGWRVDDARPLPQDDGLPSGAVLLALTEITR